MHYWAERRLGGLEGWDADSSDCDRLLQPMATSDSS
jgi:hypothetical protein